MIEIDEIHVLLSSMETRIEQLENTLEGRLLLQERQVTTIIHNELVKIEKPVVPLWTKLVIFLVRVKQYLLEGK